eukprot:TRINITY_DN51036_c0_g1_i2.p1 TRINITY_DN51036_c0_g1~~TRINITY_DN51036_c0_g1_i2.p1  ORF type:complete len:190 (+),score=31.60 TRINITY_DN51036_c0_g1_i2:3-572(+)
MADETLQHLQEECHRALDRGVPLHRVLDFVTRVAPPPTRVAPPPQQQSAPAPPRAAAPIRVPVFKDPVAPDRCSNDSLARITSNAAKLQAMREKSGRQFQQQLWRQQQHHQQNELDHQRYYEQGVERADQPRGPVMVRPRHHPREWRQETGGARSPEVHWEEECFESHVDLVTRLRLSLIHISEPTRPY